jgi:methylated-DNA-[protein]-cysteine S-methyltransferase
VELTAIYDSPLGPITLASDGDAITGLRFGAIERMDTIDAIDSIEIFRRTRCWLDLYFSGQRPDFLPPLKPSGTAFQQRVWQTLMEIPYGETTTYGAIARRVGCRSAQAVGQAVGHNHIAIIVPCHRVVGSDGSMTGYAYGIERKEYLLALESKSPASPLPPPRGNVVTR